MADLTAEDGVTILVDEQIPGVALTDDEEPPPVEETPSPFRYVVFRI
jgi:hypothetical protein